MTEETRAELRLKVLRAGIEGIIRQDAIGWPWEVKTRAPEGIEPSEVCATPQPPPLTTAQQLALSVLLGDEAVLPDALADCLIDQGHEYAAAVAEKARREERRRIVGLIRAWADDAYDAGEAEQSEMLTALVEVVEE